MCLTIPAKIIKIDKNKALVEDYQNNKKEVIVSAISNPRPNEWLLINGNLAIQAIDSGEAADLINLLNT